MKSVSLIFPHQLFKINPCLKEGRDVILVEEYLFFKQYKFHKQKIAYHRATMQYYAAMLRDQGYNVRYIESASPLSDIRDLIKHFHQQQLNELHFCDVTDNWLAKRIHEAASPTFRMTIYPSPMFLNSIEDIKRYFNARKTFFQTDFYIDQRKKRGILVDQNKKPLGGHWSFDADNRKKFPASEKAPAITFPIQTPTKEEAIQYCEDSFGDHYGKINGRINFPSTHQESEAWLEAFLNTRFEKFGIYEDAIVDKESILHHSVLTPMLNTGLLTPDIVVTRALEVAEKRAIPLNSVEGFIRQVIGWREFMRSLYALKGTYSRTRNYWKFTRRLPYSFYTGDTGIVPVDTVIKKVLNTGYCHHIERLMVLGNFMLLCEFHPDDVYRWFMEMFIDAYDWVMVPNVYSMSQFADGGIMATKPYISGSNYIMKMSNFKKGEWQAVWDGLFWSFMDKHRYFFESNPRLNMLLRTFDAMEPAKREKHLMHAANYLEKLDEQANSVAH